MGREGQEVGRGREEGRAAEGLQGQLQEGGQAVVVARHHTAGLLQHLWKTVGMRDSQGEGRELGDRLSESSMGRVTGGRATKAPKLQKPLVVELQQPEELLVVELQVHPIVDLVILQGDVVLQVEAELLVKR